MSLIDVAKSTLTGLAIADTLKERLSLAFDRASELESQNTSLQKQVAVLDVQVANITIDRDKAQQELKRLQKEHEEETIIHGLLEFRRGKRTSNKWLPFCPVFHAPAGINPQSNRTVVYCIGECSKKPNAGLITYLSQGTTLESLVAKVERMVV